MPNCWLWGVNSLIGRWHDILEYSYKELVIVHKNSSQYSLLFTIYYLLFNSRLIVNEQLHECIVFVMQTSFIQALCYAQLTKRSCYHSNNSVLPSQDVHTEFSPGWAEAALQYIQQHPNTIVQPVVEELEVNKITWPSR